MPDTRLKGRHCSICLVCTSDVPCVWMDESICSVGKNKLVEASRASRVSSPGYPRSHTTARCYQIDNCGRVRLEMHLSAFFGRFETAKNKLAIWGIKFRDRWPKRHRRSSTSFQASLKMLDQRCLETKHGRHPPTEQRPHFHRLPADLQGLAQCLISCYAGSKSNTPSPSA